MQIGTSFMKGGTLLIQFVVLLDCIALYREVLLLSSLPPLM